MGFFHLCLKNMLRHRTRTLLTMLSILVSVGVLFAVISYDRSFSAALEREMRNTGVHITVVPTGCAHEAAAILLHGGSGPGMLSRSDVDQVRNLLGDRAAGLYPLLIVQAANTHKEGLDVVFGLNRQTMSGYKPGWNLAQGHFPQSSRELLLGHQKAAQAGVKVGDTLSYITGGRLAGEVQSENFRHKLEEIEKSLVQEHGLVEEFQVAGILAPTGTQDDGAVFAPLSAAYELLGHARGLSALGVRLDSPEQAGSISRELEAGFPGIQAVTPDHLLGTVTDVARSARVLSFSMVVLVAVISASGVMNSILMTVFERTREIGAMRALGASRLDVFRMTMSEALVLTGIGGALGIIAVSAAAPIVQEFARRFLPYVPEGLTMGFDPLVALICLGFSMAIGVLAGLYPAVKSSGISPVEAMRN